MANISSGEQAPDIELRNIDGETVNLSEMWGNGRSALFIFLRHLN